MAALRNITLTLDAEVLRAARVLAAQEGISVSALLRRQIMSMVEKQRRYATARDAALRRLERGQALGIGRVKRGELHDREALR